MPRSRNNEVSADEGQSDIVSASSQRRGLHPPRFARFEVRSGLRVLNDPTDRKAESRPCDFFQSRLRREGLNKSVPRIHSVVPHRFRFLAPLGPVLTICKRHAFYRKARASLLGKMRLAGENFGQIYNKINEVTWVKSSGVIYYLQFGAVLDGHNLLSVHC